MEQSPLVFTGLLLLLGLIYWLLAGPRKPLQSDLATVTDLFIQPGKPLIIPQPEGPGRFFDSDKRLVRLRLRSDATYHVIQVDGHIFRDLNIGNVVSVDYFPTPWGKKVVRIRP